MSQHQKYIDLAMRLIAKHGRDVIFKRISSVPGDSSQPWRGTTTPPQEFGPYKAAFVPFRGFEFGSFFTDTDLFKSVEELCLCAGGDRDLETMHMILDANRNYKIEWTRRLRVGDQTILYAMGVVG